MTFFSSFFLRSVIKAASCRLVTLPDAEHTVYGTLLFGGGGVGEGFRGGGAVLLVDDMEGCWLW